MVVTKSSRHTLVQIIDDVAGKTLVSASTMEPELRALSGDKSAKAVKVGELIGQARQGRRGWSRSSSTARATSTTAGLPPWQTPPARPGSDSETRRKVLTAMSESQRGGSRQGGERRGRDDRRGRDQSSDRTRRTSI